MLLRRRLEGVVGVSISQGDQTITVEFAGGVFQPLMFRDAVAEAGLDILALRIDTCGTIEERADQYWLIAGQNQFALADSPDAPIGQLCASGALDDLSNPSRLVLTAMQKVGN